MRFYISPHCVTSCLHLFTASCDTLYLGSPNIWTRAYGVMYKNYEHIDNIQTIGDKCLEKRFRESNPSCDSTLQIWMYLFFRTWFRHKTMGVMMCVYKVDTGAGTRSRKKCIRVQLFRTFTCSLNHKIWTLILAIHDMSLTRSVFELYSFASSQQW